MKGQDSRRSTPRILVLLASYNGHAWLCEQVDSILNQNSAVVHLLVRDDGSNAATVSMLRLLSEKEEIDVIFAPGGSGASGNFFNLIEACGDRKYDYFAFADQDDVWDPDHLIKAVDALECQKADLYSGPVVAFWPNGSELRLSQKKQTTEFDFLFEGAGQGCTYVMTKRLVLKVKSELRNHWDLARQFRYHDWFVYVICRLNNFKWIYGDEVCLRYRQHPHNDTGSRYSVSGIRFRVNKLMDGVYWRQCDLVFDLYKRKRSPEFLPESCLSWRYFRRGRRKRIDRALIIIFFVAHRIFGRRGEI